MISAPSPCTEHNKSIELWVSTKTHKILGILHSENFAMLVVE